MRPGWKNVAPTLTIALIGAVLGLMMVSGALRPLDRALMDWRFRMLDRSPSDSLVIVEIDSRSLEEENRWPWSRALYARAVRNLKAAGANVIAFDVDFSSRGDDEGDKNFREALGDFPGQILLPEFHQSRLLERDASSLKRTAPHPYFLESAALASVNFSVERNGILRKGLCGSGLADAYRGSIAAILADLPQQGCDSFLIDYSIDPARLRRLSFVDVERGDFDPSLVAGKQVIIGATAVELGDEFATPTQGLLPGIMLHALSYESLVQGRAIRRLNDGLTMAIAVLWCLWLIRAGAHWSLRTLFVHGLTLGLALLVPLAIQASFPLSLNTAPIIAAQLLAVAWMVIVEMKQRAQALVNERLETLKHQALIALVVRDSSDGVIITDERGQVLVCNERASILLGVEKDALAGELIGKAAPGFPALDRSSHSAAAAERPDLAEYAVTAAGADRVLEIASACTSHEMRQGWRGPAPAARQIYFTYCLRDVSARKAFEEAERKAKEAAIAAVSFKNQLISNMSHELRTPLNSIVGFAEVLLREEHDVSGNSTPKKYADYIRRSGERMLGLINDILFISQVRDDVATVAADSYALEEIWNDCLSAFRDEIVAERKVVSTNIPPEFPPLLVNYEIFSRALRHLLSNAVKFTGGGGKIALTADYSPEMGARITLADDGVGVGAEQLSKLSEAFFQADASLRRRHEGAGLGLFVARKCLALFGGALTFESSLGDGFKCIIALPPSIAATARAAA